MSRISAMHANELINVKARYKTLHNTKVDNKVIQDGKEVRLDIYLKQQKVNETPLFLAVE